MSRNAQSLLPAQVPRYMGFGSEWKPRWCVIMPRIPNPVTGGPREKHVVRSLLVVYKAADQHVPFCKAWLDGAVARTVVGSRGQSQAQCALVSSLCHWGSSVPLDRGWVLAAHLHCCL